MSRLVEDLYDDDFSAVVAETSLILVDCYTDWCGPCKAVAPVVERAAKAYEGRVRVAKLNTEGNPETARRLHVTSVPTLLLFRDGRVAARLSGYQSDAALRRCLDAHAPPPTSPAAPPGPPRGLLSRLLGRK